MLHSSFSKKSTHPSSAALVRIDKTKGGRRTYIYIAPKRHSAIHDSTCMHAPSSLSLDLYLLELGLDFLHGRLGDELDDVLISQLLEVATELIDEEEGHGAVDENGCVCERRCVCECVYV